MQIFDTNSEIGFRRSLYAYKFRCSDLWCAVTRARSRRGVGSQWRDVIDFNNRHKRIKRLIINDDIGILNSFQVNERILGLVIEFKKVIL